MGMLKKVGWVFRALKVRYRGIYKKSKGVRGATRLKTILDRLSEAGLEKVEEDDAVSIFDKEEWDNLIILDACRADVYKDVFGDCEVRVSVGSNTPEFLAKTFSRGKYQDLVAITGNPHYHEEKFREIVGRKPSEVFDTVFPVFENNWDQNENVVLPEDIAEKAIVAEELFPDKKKIIHFMQPHYPFIEHEFEREYDEERFSNEYAFALAERGLLDEEEIYRAYKQNLRTAKDSIEKVINQLSGKTIVTADHGNLVGENGLYGHPPKSSAKALREVPWDIRN